LWEFKKRTNKGREQKKWKGEKKRKVKVGEQIINIKKSYGHVSSYNFTTK
jgi:hypothetical protein